MKYSKTFYKISRFVLITIYKLIFNPKIIGKENIKKEGPIILAGNHINMFDPCNVIISTGRHVRFFAKKPLFEKFIVGKIFNLTGCFPVDPDNKNDASVKEALEVLKNGGVIGIFPEGKRNYTDEKLLPLKYGAVSIAKKANVSIVPFAITGKYKFRSKNLTIEFGEEFDINNKSLEEANLLLYEKIMNILNKSK